MGRWRNGAQSEEVEEAAPIEVCSECKAKPSASAPLTLDRDKRLYCDGCWKAYYGRSPPRNNGGYQQQSEPKKQSSGYQQQSEPKKQAVAAAKKAEAATKAANELDALMQAKQTRGKQSRKEQVADIKPVVSSTPEADDEDSDEGFWGVATPVVASIEAAEPATAPIAAQAQTCPSVVKAAAPERTERADGGVDNVASSEIASPALAAAARFAREMAKLCTEDVEDASLVESAMDQAMEQQQEELETLTAIYGEALKVADVPSGASALRGRRPRTFTLELTSEVGGGVDLLVDTADGRVQAGTVQHLPPLVLQCALPCTYPLQRRPVAVVCAEYIPTAELQELENELSTLAEERQGESVLFEWASLLQERASSVPSSLVLGSRDEAADGGAGMEAALRLLAADRRVRDERRLREMHQCPVCFDDVLGSRGIFLECDHFGCRDCLGEMARLHTGEADITALRCPVTDCREQFGFEALRELLGADSPALARWEELSLQQCLDKMQDVTYCPRCDLDASGHRVPCIQDEDGMAQCQACGFAFCGKCRDAYHPGMPCTSTDDRMDALEARANGTSAQAQAARAELATLRQLARTTKQCPTCTAAIEKVDGCSKMHCRVCDTLWCWRCTKVIQGYDHFATGACKLFDDEEIKRWNAQAHNVLRAEARAHEARFLAQFIDPATMWEQLRACPQCKAAVIKEGKNNHLRCHSCLTHFCGRCRAWLPKQRPGDHFKVGGGGCPQHSAE